MTKLNTYINIINHLFFQKTHKKKLHYLGNIAFKINDIFGLLLTS